jgi:cystathionine beta-synthase
MKYYNNVVELIGNTPLVKLNKVTDGIACTVLAKVEYFNPGGSIKDRIAEKLIDAAEAAGQLKPGGTIVEPTSGNTGIGLALVAQQRGYKCIFVLPDKVAVDKINTLKAYGAEVVVCPTNVAHEDPRSYYSVSDRLANEIPGAFKPDQYSNLNGPASHYETTGPEIWKDTDGKVTHVVIGVGTGGTVSGTGKYLKEVSNGAVQIIGCDPAGSVYSNGTGRPYLVEGGLLVGPSCGMAVVAALRVAKDLPADAVVVVILPDGGRGYLAKVFNEVWLRAYGFMPRLDTAVQDLVTGTQEQPQVTRVKSKQTIADALALNSEFVVVFDNSPPVRYGEISGVLRLEHLKAGLASGAFKENDLVSAHMESRPIPLGYTDTIETAREELSDADCALVLREGEVIALLTTSLLP